MNDFTSSLVLQWVLPICFLAMALITATFGSLLLKSLPKQISANTTHRNIPYQRFYGFLLLTSAIGWAGLGTGINSWTNQAQVAEIQQLPATAAGISSAAAFDPSDHTPAKTAITATIAEELAEQPKSPEFQKLRKQVTELLFSSESFDETESSVRINLQDNKHRATIKYLADERPGLLTVIYHKQEAKKPLMVVYFPEVIGNELIYTPLTGPSSSAISKMIVD